MSDLRDEIARAVAETTDLPGTWDRFPDERAGWLLTADAVLRVVGERLLSDEAVEAATLANRDTDPALGEWSQLPAVAKRLWLDGERAALSAAWRVVTGSNHE